MYKQIYDFIIIRNFYIMGNMFWKLRVLQNVSDGQKDISNCVLASLLKMELYIFFELKY